MVDGCLRVAIFCTSAGRVRHGFGRRLARGSRVVRAARENEVRFQLHTEGRGGDLWHVIRHGHALMEGDGDGRLVGCQQSTET